MLRLRRSTNVAEEASAPVPYALAPTRMGRGARAGVAEDRVQKNMVPESIVPEKNFPKEIVPQEMVPKMARKKAVPYRKRWFLQYSVVTDDNNKNHNPNNSYEDNTYYY